MNNISTQCPRCGFSLDIPPDFDNVICGSCATAYWVRRHGGGVNLSAMWPEAEDGLLKEIDAGAAIEERLAEIDQLIEEAETEIEALRSREQSGPLQIGCAFFGLFMVIVVVSALFMLLGRSYLGGWMYYMAVAVAVFLGIVRIRRKLSTRSQREELRKDRLHMKESLTQLIADRDRIQSLRTRLGLKNLPAKDQND